MMENPLATQGIPKIGDTLKDENENLWTFDGVDWCVCDEENQRWVHDGVEWLCKGQDGNLWINDGTEWVAKTEEQAYWVIRNEQWVLKYAPQGSDGLENALSPPCGQGLKVATLLQQQQQQHAQQGGFQQPSVMSGTGQQQGQQQVQSNKFSSIKETSTLDGISQQRGSQERSSFLTNVPTERDFKPPKIPSRLRISAYLPPQSTSRTSRTSSRTSSPSFHQNDKYGNRFLSKTRPQPVSTYFLPPMSPQIIPVFIQEPIAPPPSSQEQSEILYLNSTHPKIAGIPVQRRSNYGHLPKNRFSKTEDKYDKYDNIPSLGSCLIPLRRGRGGGRGGGGITQPYSNQAIPVRALIKPPCPFKTKVIDKYGNIKTLEWRPTAAAAAQAAAAVAGTPVEETIEGGAIILKNGQLHPLPTTGATTGAITETGVSKRDRSTSPGMMTSGRKTAPAIISTTRPGTISSTSTSTSASPRGVNQDDGNNHLVSSSGLSEIEGLDFGKLKFDLTNPNSKTSVDGKKRSIEQLTSLLEIISKKGRQTPADQLICSLSQTLKTLLSDSMLDRTNFVSGKLYDPNEANRVDSLVTRASQVMSEGADGIRVLHSGVSHAINQLLDLWDHPTHRSLNTKDDGERIRIIIETCVDELFKRKETFERLSNEIDESKDRALKFARGRDVSLSSCQCRPARSILESDNKQLHERLYEALSENKVLRNKLLVSEIKCLQHKNSSDFHKAQAKTLASNLPFSTSFHEANKLADVSNEKIDEKVNLLKAQVADLTQAHLRGAGTDFAGRLFNSANAFADSLKTSGASRYPMVPPLTQPALRSVNVTAPSPLAPVNINIQHLPLGQLNEALHGLGQSQSQQPQVAAKIDDALKNLQGMVSNWRGAQDTETQKKLAKQLSMDIDELAFKQLPQTMRPEDAEMVRKIQGLAIEMKQTGEDLKEVRPRGHVDFLPSYIGS